jgi:hypothetical protein
VRYRSFARCLALDGIYRPLRAPPSPSLAKERKKNATNSSGCVLGQPDSRKGRRAGLAVALGETKPDDARARGRFVKSAFENVRRRGFAAKAANGIVTLLDAPFQRTWARERTAHANVPFRDHNSGGDSRTKKKKKEKNPFFSFPRTTSAAKDLSYPIFKITIQG